MLLQLLNTYHLQECHDLALTMGQVQRAMVKGTWLGVVSYGGDGCANMGWCNEPWYQLCISE